MRQEIKKEDTLKQYINLSQSLYAQGLVDLNTNEVNPEMIGWFKKTLVSKLLYITIAHYTLGSYYERILTEYIKVVNFIKFGWISDNVKLNQNGKMYNQYPISNYDEMLWMLSLGYLLAISDEDFQKLVEVIDRDGVKDYLFEFIIRAKLKDREPITSESYREFFGVPKCFEKLRQAITETDKIKAEELVKDFITKDWYKNHKDAGWYNSHKSKHDTYFGYWSFETAAVVKIMGLDDSSFVDAPYYPKDLVHD